MNSIEFRSIFRWGPVSVPCQWRVDSWLSSEVILSYKFAQKIGKNLSRKTNKKMYKSRRNGRAAAEYDEDPGRGNGGLEDAGANA
jgi:hypothetical protein